MSWTPVMEKAPSPQEEVWASNADINAAWRRHVAKRGAKNTQRNLTLYVNVFLNVFKPLATTLERADIEAFMDRMAGKCSKLINGREPMCRIGHDITGCPLVNNTPATGCADYRPLDPSGLWSYICAINRFYEWLLEEGRIARNPAIAVMRDFASRHSLLFDERRRKPRRRVLTADQVKLLVEQSPLHHGVAYLLLARGFLRIHEALKLRVDSDYLNLEEGWLDIPLDYDLGNKRKGNRRIYLDSSGKRMLRRYLSWRDDHVRRGENGRPHNVLLITTFGRPWGANGIHNLNTALHADCIRLNLMTGRETERQERISSHAFRAFATTWARGKGIPTADLMVMRGDLSGGGNGTLERYDDYMQRLPAMFEAYAPALDLT